MPKTNLETIKTLEQKIAVGRFKLQNLYEAHDATTPEVLALSIKLDKLMNEYERRR